MEHTELHSLQQEDIDRARVLAIRVHGDQKYGSRPYSYHLESVVKVLERFGLNSATAPTIIIAAWLHDSIEDTPLTRDDIAAQFGRVVAELVWRVTNEDGKNRKARHLVTYPKIRADEAAVILKLADRIANVFESDLNFDGTVKNQKLLEMYRKEHGEFRAALYRMSDNAVTIKMWEYIDGLISQTDVDREYNVASDRDRLVQELEDCRRPILNAEMRQVLCDALQGTVGWRERARAALGERKMIPCRNCGAHFPDGGKRKKTCGKC